MTNYSIVHVHGVQLLGGKQITASFRLSVDTNSKNVADKVARVGWPLLHYWAERMGQTRRGWTWRMNRQDFASTIRDAFAKEWKTRSHDVTGDMPCPEVRVRIEL